MIKSNDHACRLPDKRLAGNKAKPVAPARSTGGDKKGSINHLAAIILSAISMTIALILQSVAILHAQENDVFSPETKNQELSDLSIEELMNVKVNVASNISTALKKQPASVTVINAKQLKMSGARTLNEAIMMFVPGCFKVEDQDDVIIGFRGMAPDNNVKVMLLINGQNMNTEYFWGPPPAILGTIDYDWIERIEVIRGPGSVTLGQGALLGVINIVTKKGSDAIKDGISAGVKMNWGPDQYLHTSGYALMKQADLAGFFYASYTDFTGRRMKNEGWIMQRANDGYLGGTLHDKGMHLDRGKNITALGNISYKGFTLNYFYTDHQKDLYNFQRDRDVLEEKIFSISSSYVLKITDDLRFSIEGSYIQDNFYLFSIEGLTAGGTREDRWGLKAILNADNLFLKGNHLALGYEFRRFEMGKKNTRGDNFIINKFDAATLTGLPYANELKTMVYRDYSHVHSLFMEDFYDINDMFTIFAGVRYDHHTYWGYNISPRLGLFITPVIDLRTRISYQSGFRGAPGLHYAGGYRNDGFLREENFDQVASSVPGQQNIPEVKPETMHCFEIESSWDPIQGMNLDLVWFYNIIRYASDVSAFDATQPIGSDIPGDWNGYWFYKNTPGDIHFTGLEPAITYTSRLFHIQVSHAWVYLVWASSSSLYGSMYVTENQEIKAYPENVTRLSVSVTPTAELSITLNYLYYWWWISPNDNRIRGNHILNVGISYEIIEGLNLSIIGKNLLYHLYDQSPYPMNNVAGDGTLSDGTPALEQTSFWIGASYEI